MKNRLLIIALLAVFTFTGCQKQVAELASSSDGKKCKVQEVNFKYLTAKAKARFSSGGSDNSFSLNIRMKKNKIIWLSASMIIEGARCKITPDSVYVINRLKKDYYAYSFEELSQMLHTKVSFNSIQSIILGNLYSQPARQTSFDFDDSHCILSQNEGSYNVKSYILNENQKVEKIEVSKNGVSAMQLKYGEFKPVEKFLFPFTISLSSQGEKEEDNVVMDLDFKSVNFVKKAPKFPFTIPDSYEQAK